MQAISTQHTFDAHMAAHCKHEQRRAQQQQIDNQRTFDQQYQSQPIGKQGTQREQTTQGMTSIQGGVVGEDGVDGDVEGDDPGQEEEGEAPAAHVEPTQEMVDAIFDEIFDEDPDFVCDQTALKRRRTSESERTAAGTTEIADGTISDPETMKFSDGEIFDAPVQA